MATHPLIGVYAGAAFGPMTRMYQAKDGPGAVAKAFDMVSAYLAIDGNVRVEARRFGNGPDSTITPGELAYAADVRATPAYHTGEPRPAWADLDRHARQSWERNPSLR